MSRRIRALLGGLIAFLVVLACNEHGLVPIDEAIQVERQDTFTQLETNQIDILFVIDNSNSMCQEQEALTGNFDLFIEGLTQINADFHLAVVTTDMQTDNGRFQSSPGIVGEECDPTPPTLNCGATTGPVLASVDYRMDPNDELSDLDVSSLLSDFRCIATVGTRGSGFEKGLSAMRTGLGEDMLGTVNAGFRRPAAWMAIIFVSDENDCSDGGALDLADSRDCEWLRDSLIPVEDFVEFTNGVEGLDDPETAEPADRLLVAGIIGPDNGVRANPPDPPRASCTNPDTGDAFAGYRYESFIDAFGSRGVTANICLDTFDTALDQIAQVIRANLAVKCLADTPRTCDGDADCAPGEACQDRGTAGVGIRVCESFDVVVERRSTGGETWETLVSVDDAPTPADGQFSINYEASSCPSGIGIEFQGGNEPGPGTQFRIRYPIVLGADGPTEGGDQTSQ